MICCAVVGPAGVTKPILFLIDSGADRTIITAEVAEWVGADFSPLDFAVHGVVSSVPTAKVGVNLKIERDDGGEAEIRGPLVACTEPGVIDECILGRDVLGNFCLVLHERNDLICLLAGNHRCRIERA